MKIAAKFTPAQVSKILIEKVARIETAILEDLKFIGETFVRDARNGDTYKDQTGNLRSSIGYYILKDGKKIYSFFPGDKSTGKAKGIEAAEKIAAKHPQGYALIVVAGMFYAAAVESKGYNVLTVQSFKAIDDINNMVARLKSKIK
jgi:hypothetical protein